MTNPKDSSRSAFVEWLKKDESKAGLVDYAQTYITNEQNYKTAKIFEDAILNKTSRPRDMLNAWLTGEWIDPSYRKNDYEIVSPKSDWEIVEDYDLGYGNLKNALKTPVFNTPQDLQDAENKFAYQLASLAVRQNDIQEGWQEQAKIITDSLGLDPENEKLWEEQYLPKLNPQLAKDAAASAVLSRTLSTLYNKGDKSKFLENLYAELKKTVGQGQLIGESNLLGYQSTAYGNVFQTLEALLGAGMTSNTMVTTPALRDKNTGEMIPIPIGELIAELLGFSDVHGLNTLADTHSQKFRFAGILGGSHPSNYPRYGKIENGEYIPFDEKGLNQLVTRNYGNRLGRLPSLRALATHLLLQKTKNVLGESRGKYDTEGEKIQKLIAENVLSTSDVGADSEFAKSLEKDYTQ